MPEVREKPGSLVKILDCHNASCVTELTCVSFHEANQLYYTMQNISNVTSMSNLSFL